MDSKYAIKNLKKRFVSGAMAVLMAASVFLGGGFSLTAKAAEKNGTPKAAETKATDYNLNDRLEGDVVSFEGIKFRIDYYANLYNSRAEAEASGSPNASAIFATDESGVLLFRYAEPIDGTTWPYKTESAQGKFENTAPLGTLVITELTVPDGMTVSGVGSVVQIIADPDKPGRTKRVKVEGWANQNTSSDAIGTFANSIFKGSVRIPKADADEHEQNAQGDGSLDAIEYTIYNRSAHDIMYNGKRIAAPAEEGQDGGVVTTVRTGEEEPSVAIARDLPYGTYRVEETNANASYNKNSWSQVFSIRSNNQVIDFDKENWNEDYVQRGEVEVTKADRDTGLSRPQGDAELANTSYEVYNRSEAKVYWNHTWFAPGAKMATVQTEWNEERQAYVAELSSLPYGTYEWVEVGAPIGYHLADYRKTTKVRHEGEVVQVNDAASGYNVDAVFRGGVSITKADADWHTSKPQGDATLEGVTYDIVNRSKNAVFMEETSELYEPGEVVLTLTTRWNEATQSYMAETGRKSLPYGTYEIVERTASTGYNNANWSETFTIRQENEMHYFDRTEPNVTGPTSDYVFHHKWNENHVMRGGITVGKVDRETGQYISLGEAHLDGAVFEVINRSAQPVYVDGKTYKVGDVVMNITTKEMEVDGKKIYAATTGNYVLPYGTYEVKEIKSGTGYLFDSTSKAYTKTVQIRDEGHMVNLTDEADAVANQVIREDWHFQKKQEDSMERMDKIAFLVESLTTGERHVLVTDENGTWGSAWISHTEKTNENDPTSPISNGALGIKEDGTWYVQDSSKLNFDSGMWFTGMPEDMTQWAEDGKSYTVNGTSVKVDDKKRAFPYDTYRVQELRCDNNVGYKLVNFTVTLHRYTADHDGPGLDIDYGTIDDKRIAIGTTLTYGASDKVVPAGAEITLRDTVTYDNLDVSKKYVMKGELHLVNEDGTDGGVITEAEKEFNSGNGAGKMVLEFNVNTADLAGKSLVAFEYLTDNGQVIAEHEDISDENQTVKVPEIRTTLHGDLGHVSNAGATEIKLTDKISYKNLEVGKEYVAHGTLMNKATGEAVTDADGNPVTAEKTFVPVSEEGSVDVVFIFVNPNLAGETVVAFESVTKDDVEYAVHADIEDADQSVSFPEVDSFAVDEADKNKDLAEAKEQAIHDAVNVTNLDKSYEYKLSGELHVRNEDGTDGGVLKNKDDKAYTAEVTWKGSKADQHMVFEHVDASKLGGKDIVVYQTLSGRKDSDGKWIVLGEHKDISDADQSVHIPHIGTTLVTGQEIHESQVPVDGNITLKDTVAYKNVTPGHEYAVVGTLHVQDVSKEGEISDGGEVKNDKKAVQAKAVFTAKESDGTVDVTFKFDATGLEGKSVTAFETLYSSPSKEVSDDWKEFFPDEDEKFDDKKLDDKWIVAKHENIKDSHQTVHFAKIKTTLKSDTGVHESQVPAGEDKTVTLTDVISYKNLIPGREYTATGTLHVQEKDKDGKITDGGAVKDAEGKEVTASATFTPVEANGKVEVVFTFDASGLDGKTVVAFESLSADDKEFAVHADIEDEAQSVHFVKIGTTALTEDKLHEVQAPAGKDATVTIIDTVKYENVIPGNEYTMTGTLHIQHVDADGTIHDGGAVKDKDGDEVTGTKTFTAEKANGTVDITFTFDASELNGQTVVAFETLTKDEKFVAHHEDITDEEQSIHFIDLHTTATAENGLHETQIPSGEDKKVTITDRVEYSNLIPGTEYEMAGTLHLQEVDKDGKVTDGGALKEVASKVTFKPESANGFVDLTFTVDASDLDGKTVVAFEELSKNGIVIGVHADIEDEDQSVRFVKIHTTALADNEQHMTYVPTDVNELVTITDTIAYENLIPGVTYEVSGILHIQDVDENGKVVDGGTVKTSPAEESDSEAPAEGEEDNRPDVVAETTFTPETPNGTVDVTFTFPASELAGKTVVAFETLSRDGKIVATHTDIEDDEQSVHFVKIRTKALAENGEHEMTIPKGEDKTVKVTDLVEYKNLIPGQEYHMSGEFHIQLAGADGTVTDGGVLTGKDGKPVTAETTFTPKEADGSVEVIFDIDATTLGNKTIVAFETLTYEEAVIAVHTDITDKHQSVKFLPTPGEPVSNTEEPEIIKTGQLPLYVLFAVLGIAMMAGAGYFIVRKKRG